MKRYKQKFAVVGLAGLLAVLALTISAAPASASLVCPPGTKVPSLKYCANVPPAAITQPATNVKSGSAQLNGTVGPDIAGGDTTSYHFDYGTTSSYGLTTPTGTVSGASATTGVSAVVLGLRPCTTYHYRVDASNPDGSVLGADQSFMTAFEKPIASVSAPRTVVRTSRHKKHYFKITVKLRTRVTKLTVQLQRTFVVRAHHRRRTFTVVYSRTRKHNVSGTVVVHFKAPHLRGKYTIKVVGFENCGSQTVRRHIRVKRF